MLYSTEKYQDDEVDDIAGDHSDEDEAFGSRDNVTSSETSTPVSSPVSSPYVGRSKAKGACAQAATLPRCLAKPSMCVCIHSGGCSAGQRTGQCAAAARWVGHHPTPTSSVSASLGVQGGTPVVCAYFLFGILCSHSKFCV
jgi:hypothetical protein